MKYRLISFVCWSLLFFIGILVFQRQSLWHAQQIEVLEQKHEKDMDLAESVIAGYEYAIKSLRQLSSLLIKIAADNVKFRRSVDREKLISFFRKNSFDKPILCVVRRPNQNPSYRLISVRRAGEDTGFLVLIKEKLSDVPVSIDDPCDIEQIEEVLIHLSGHFSALNENFEMIEQFEILNERGERQTLQFRPPVDDSVDAFVVIEIGKATQTNE